MVSQFVDPNVSAAKFEAEIEDFRALEGEYRRRGWILVAASFPVVLVLMAATQLKAPPLVPGLLFDYSNYDTPAPHVSVGDPLLWHPYPAPGPPTQRRTSVD